MTNRPASLAAATPAPAYRVAVVMWKPYDGMAQAIAAALTQLGHTALPFVWQDHLPDDVDVVLSQGPYGPFLHVPRQLGALPPERRPVMVHWNDEGLPDPRLPWPVMSALGALRSGVGRLDDSPRPLVRGLAQRPPVRWIGQRMLRFRYLGDYHYAYRQGWLSLLVDFSTIYAELHQAHGLRAIAVPWGSIPDWSADLKLPRDIDVLWMGARATRRRAELLDRVRGELRQRGIEMYVADNEEHPFIFADERTRMLNRAKVTLNLTRTWYDDNFLRFPIVMPNRSLVVSEPLLPHCAEYVAGTHYVAAPIAELAATIEHYLAHADERQRIVENAYQLVTTELTLANCVNRILTAITGLKARAPAAARAH